MNKNDFSLLYETVKSGELLKKLKTIIVDDSFQFRQALKGMMKGKEFIEILGEAANGVEAVDLASTHNPDLIIMDINMPVMSGIESAAMIRKMYPAIKIIILSVYKDPEYIEEFRKIGLDAFLVKGEDDTKIIETIKNIFNIN